MRNEQQSTAPPMLPAFERRESVAGGLFEEGRIVVTPAIAQQILDRFNYANQRRISPPHVAKLAHEMTSGVWTPGSQIAFGVMPDQRVHLVNGQHRLAAVVQAQVSIEFQLLLIPCATLDDLHALYYRFDAVQRSRTTEVVLQSVGVADHYHIPRTLAKAAYHAGLFIALGLRNVPGGSRPAHLGTPDGALNAIEPWWPYVRKYGDIIAECDAPNFRRKLTSSSVMAVALVTLKYQPTKAAEFWSGVALNLNMEKGDPRRTLNIALNERSLLGIEQATMIACSVAWNAWFSGRQLKILTVTVHSSCAPLGTPFASRRS